MADTFTDFMVNAMAGQDEVSQAVLIVRREDGTIGYRVFNQHCADTLGLMRFAALSVENDLIKEWEQGV